MIWNVYEKKEKVAPSIAQLVERWTVELVFNLRETKKKKEKNIHNTGVYSCKTCIDYQRYDVSTQWFLNVDAKSHEHFSVPIFFSLFSFFSFLIRPTNGNASISEYVCLTLVCICVIHSCMCICMYVCINVYADIERRFRAARKILYSPFPLSHP